MTVSPPISEVWKQECFTVDGITLYTGRGALLCCRRSLIFRQAGSYTVSLDDFGHSLLFSNLIPPVEIAFPNFQKPSRTDAFFSRRFPFLSSVGRSFSFCSIKNSLLRYTSLTSSGISLGISASSGITSSWIALADWISRGFCFCRCSAGTAL